jgi:excisionase family DNA binding protein
LKKAEIHIPWESLPDTLTAQHICNILGISKRRIYELFEVHVEHGGIPTFRIGASIRVGKEEFIQWHEGRKYNNSK